MTTIRKNRIRSEREIKRGLESGDKLREEGMSRAACKNAGRIAAGKVNLLNAMLSRSNMTGTADDIALRLDEKYSNRGMWVGSVIQELLRQSIITLVGHVKSARPSRHGGLTGQYRIVDAHKAQEFLASLSR